jgi:uncharacterized membrane protein
VSGDQRRRTAVILAICLLISLALNLFMAGAFLAGRWMNRPVASAVEAVMRSYPPALRDEVKRKLFQDRESLRAAITDLAAARQRMFALMRADPLDEAALRDAMAEVRIKTMAVQARLQAALLASLKEAPAAEREKIEPPRLGFGIGRLRESGP